MAIEKLIENFIITKKDIQKIPLTESDKRIVCEGKEYSPTDIFRFKIWKLNEKNLNSRVYSEKLAEYAISIAPEYTFGLINHPSDDGDFGKVWAIERNPQILKDDIGKKCLYVDFVLVGDYGRGLITDILNAGAGVPLSSSSWGEVDKNGNVLVEGFSIERWGDAVLSPSYKVYGTLDDKIQNESTQNKESNPQTNLIKETINIVEEDKSKEGIQSMNNKKTFSFEEKNFKLTVSKLIKEAEEKDDPLEKKDALEDIKEWFEDVDFAPELKKDVEDKIDVVNAEIKENAKKGLKTDKLTESQELLKKQVAEISKNYIAIDEKFEKASEMLDNMKAYSVKMKELYENQRAKTNGMITATDYKEALDFISKLEKQLNENNESNKKLSNDNKVLKESLEKSQKELNTKSIFESARIEQLKVQEQFQSEKREESYKKEASLRLEQAKKEIQEKKDTTIQIRQNNDVTEFYSDLLESNSNYAEYKNQILACKTLVEAQLFVMKLSQLVEKVYVKTSVPKLTESKQDNMEEYKFERKNNRSETGSMTSIRQKGYI